MLAGLAALGFVLQTLVMKEDLLADRPGELFAAVDASDRSVLKFCRLAVSSSWRFDVSHAGLPPQHIRCPGNTGKLFTDVTSKKS